MRLGRRAADKLGRGSRPSPARARRGLGGPAGGSARSLRAARPTDLPPGEEMHQRVPLAHSLFCMSSGRRGGTRTQQPATVRGVGREGTPGERAEPQRRKGHRRTLPAAFLLQRPPPDCAARVPRSRTSLHKQKLLLVEAA